MVSFTSVLGLWQTGKLHLCSSMHAFQTEVFMLFLLNRKRMTAHECLLHPWLTGDHSNRTDVISSSRYTNMRDKIRAKYSDWDKFVLPIGRLAEYSSLRKLLVDKYRIYDSSFGKKCSLVVIVTHFWVIA